jgi:hypothetical protein
MPMLTQCCFGAYHRRQMLQPQHAGACFGAKLAHLRRVTAGFDGVAAIPARGTSAGFIRRLGQSRAQDNCFAIFGRCYL